MAVRETDRAKKVIGVAPISLASTTATGMYYAMGPWKRVCATAMGAAVAATKTLKVELLQAQDAIGTGSKALTGTPAATATAGVLDVVDTLTVATVLVGNVVTINGLLFTAAAAAVPATRTFAQITSDTATATSLTLCINDPQYGVPGVRATSSAGVVTLYPANGYNDAAITVTGPSATITLAPVQVMAMCESIVHNMDYANGFGFIAAKLTTNATQVVSCTLDFTGGDNNPAQTLGAYMAT